MWDDLVVLQMPIAEKILRTVLVYATIVLLFRLSGKRGLAQLNTFDFVVMFLLSNAVQNAIIGEDDTVLGGVIGAVTLIAISSLLDRLIANNERVAKLLEGSPTTVVKDGRPVATGMRRLVLRRQDIERAVRVQNGDALSDVASGVFEPSGHLVVSLKRGSQTATKNDVDRILDRLAALEERIALGGGAESR
ncbi:DUF421 domain-containing protein [Thermomonospora umbrina]|uniref:Uncharacterized membrane protein YcaP (DUF421 family) n=1 Tax=Thermomonospora umbrina TaxID=111806 RepID=A0A3D9SW58_9ACTN|nr:YetF domain-containing protein [Thermomonospora umbrina]REE98253.1 uncharacterized membrane protein YcaP (DUF421 family) [Thermomonospora umbrina]